MRVLYRLVWISALLSIIGMSCWFLSAPKAAVVVAPLVGYVSDDKSLSLLHPSDWKPHSSSSQAISSRVYFEPDSATHFTVDTSLVGSLFGDMLRPTSNANPGAGGDSSGGEANGGDTSGGGSSNAALSALQGMPGMPGAGGGGGKQKSPLETIHDASLHAMAKSRSHYPDFEQGETRKMQIDGQEALATEFTFKQGDIMGRQEMVGTYITVLQKDREVDITATCSKDSQKNLKPVFDQMITSVRLGQAGG